jgi:hypothetical protein
MDTEDDALRFSFQWVVGDWRPLEKSMTRIGRLRYAYVVTLVSRLLAYGLTVGVAYVLLPNAELHVVLLIALAGSLSVWATWGLMVLSFRLFERLMAESARRVGWNHVHIDRRGITWSTETSQDYLSWLGVTDVTEEDGAIWIKTGKVSGYYLPPRLFASPAVLVTNLQTIARFRAEATRPSHLGDNGDEGPVTRH